MKEKTEKSLYANMKRSPVGSIVSFIKNNKKRMAYTESYLCVRKVGGGILNICLYLKKPGRSISNSGKWSLAGIMVEEGSEETTQVGADPLYFFVQSFDVLTI